eukprot:5506215-Pyramimonas_sp.AAC.1
MHSQTRLPLDASTKCVCARVSDSAGVNDDDDVSDNDARAVISDDGDDDDVNGNDDEGGGDDGREAPEACIGSLGGRVKTMMVMLAMMCVREWVAGG